MSADLDAAVAEEQQHVDHAYDCLEQMLVRTTAAFDHARAHAKSDWNQAVAALHLYRRSETLVDDGRALCFGRLDTEGGEVFHVGRRHVEDEGGEPVVVDWRAPVSVPFYRATFREPLGLDRRRRLVLDRRVVTDVFDEVFADPDSEKAARAAGVPDPLLAELERARSGTMRDIVATIQAEQDVVIRAPVDTPVIVQGGPGTGKTAVGLHRAAFLLYEHRETLERDGVLVLGPNRVFLAYISEVLPALGESAVVQTTISGLMPQWRVTGTDAPDVAAAKGEADLARAIEATADAALRGDETDLSVPTRWGRVTLPASAVGDLIAAAHESGGAWNQRRSRFRSSIAQRITEELRERRSDVAVDRADVTRDLRAVERELERLWPRLSATDLVRKTIRTHLGRKASKNWTLADLPLLDEAESFLNGRPRAYGHVVVDEAQDLSPMALRVVARRCRDGRSMTILGDVAQATAPGATASWVAASEHLRLGTSPVLADLATGYRVPEQVMDVANRLLPEISLELRPTSSVRPGDSAPEMVEVDEAALPDATAEQARLGLEQATSVAVIAHESKHSALADALAARGLPIRPAGAPSHEAHVVIVTPETSKGLEFDIVIVVEPAEIHAQLNGPSLLYVAMTRAVQHLVLIATGMLGLPKSLTQQP